jgi:PAS domain S-box-containing protein
VLRQLAIILRRSSNRDEILKALVQHAGIVGAGRAGVWLRDQGRQVLTLHADGQEMPLGAPVPAARAFLERRPVFEAPPAPTLALPLYEAKRVIGVLTVARDGKAAPFDPDEIGQLETALDIVSLALSATMTPADTDTDPVRTEAVAAAAAEICTCEDVDQIVERTLASTEKLFGTERAAMWLIEPGVAPRATARGIPQEFLDAVRDSYGSNVNWMSLNALRPVLIRDLSDGRASLLRDIAKRVGLRSCLLLPLGFRGQLVGVLGLYSSSYWPWSDEDVTLARSFGLQLGGAVAHSRLVGETRRQLARLDALAEVGRAGIETAGLEVRSRRVVRALLRTGEIDGIAIYILDSQHSELVLAAIHPPEYGAPERLPLSQDTMITRAVTGVRTTTSDADAPEGTLESMRKNGLVHGAAMPLVQRGKLVGAIGFGKRGARLSADTIDFIRAVADQLVGSIEVGRLFDEHAATSARLRSILASAPDGILVIDAEPKIVYANPRVMALFGFETDITGWHGERYAAAVRTRLENPELVATISEKVREQPHTPHHDRFVIARPVRRIIDRTSAPVVADDGQRLGQIVIYHELTS